MDRLLIVAILIAWTMPVSAQDQQRDPAKLKADAQKVVSIIKADKAKTQAYCQVSDLGEQMDRAVKANDKKKFDELGQRVSEVEKQLGPEYLALVDATKDVDPNSNEVQDIESLFDKLDESCPH
jgi:hypothetical protein